MADLAQAVAWHRQVAALAAAADRAGVATADLPGVRARLVAQQSRLAEAAARVGAPLPALMPTPSEIAVAGPGLGDLSDDAVTRSVQTMLSTLDAVDAALGVPAMTGPPVAPPPPLVTPPPVTPPSVTPPSVTPPTLTTPFAVGAPKAVERSSVLRNGAIYGGYATTVFAAQVALLLLLDESMLLRFSPVCLLVLPAFAWLAGYVTIGTLFRPHPTGPGEPPAPPVKRSPRLGGVICLMPNLLLCAGVGVLFVANKLAE